MSVYDDLKTSINAVIKTNGNNEITGQVLQNTLDSMVNILAAQNGKAVTGGKCCIFFYNQANVVVTPSGINATVVFGGDIGICLVTGGSNGSFNRFTPGTVALNHGQCWYWKVDTVGAEIYTDWFDSGVTFFSDPNNIPLIFCLYGYLFSPDPNLNMWLYNNQVGTKNIKMNGGELADVASYGLLAGNRYSTVANDAPLFASATKNTNHQLTITLANNVGIGLINGITSGFDWFTFDDPTFVLAHGDGLIANVVTHKIEKLTGVFGNNYSKFIDPNNILIGVNLYGYFNSPIPDIQLQFWQMFRGTARLSLKGGEIANAINSKMDLTDYFNAKIVGENPGYTGTLLAISQHGYPAAITKCVSVTEFTTPYFEQTQATATNPTGMEYLIPISSCQKIRCYFKYRSSAQITVGIYERNASGWINNSGAVIQTLPAATSEPQEQIIMIERDYEPGATQLALIFGGSNPLAPFVNGSTVQIGWLGVQMIGIPVTGDNPIEPTIVTVATSGGDFTNIREAVRSISDASATKPYKIVVKNGTYNEIDIQTRNYVDIEGESKEGVILYCDGLSTAAAPEEYGWSNTRQYSGVPINTIPKAWKHLFIHMANATVSNMTLIANQTKYVIHQDNQGNAYEAFFKDCVIIKREDYAVSVGAYDKGLLNLVGVGANPAQYQRYISCDFRLELANADNTIDFPAALYWHNWNNKTIPCGATLEKCRIFGTNIAHLSDLGSDTKDIINIIDVTVDDPKFGVRYSLAMGYYRINGVVTTDPTKVPYCIFLNIQNSDVHFVILDENRFAGIENIANAETMALVRAANVSIGQPIKLQKYGWNPEAIATDAPFAFAMQATTTEAYLFANTGTVGMGLAVAGNYEYGDPLYINGGKFTKVANGAQIGVCVLSTNLSADGYIRISKNF